MENCKKCIHYKSFFIFYKKPVCIRISNVSLKTKKNTPFKITEAYKICKGYFYECSGSVTLSSPGSTSEDGQSGQ